MRRALHLAILGFAAFLHGCGGEKSSPAGASTSGEPPTCTPPTTAPAELLEPDPRRPWAGAVVLVTEGTLIGMPHAAWRVDGAPMPPPKPTQPVSILDTRTLSEGEHTLALDVVASDQSLTTLETKFCVENGPAPSPPFSGSLVDVTAASGLPEVASTSLFSGGIAGDLDQDGDVDLFVWTPEGARVYAQVSPWVFSPGDVVATGVQAAGMGDLDGDGDLDILIAATGSAPRLLRNDQQLGHHWLRVRLVGNGTTSNRDAIGARLDVKLKSGRAINRTVNPTRSYLSQTELTITLGLGNDAIETIQVTWPDGKVQDVDASKSNELITVQQAD